ncbi:MAG TPA: PEP-CTERM sorting domain-containing protein [Verrucomicrobiae bacterium]|jgi:hypothetical protein|nr:PEP-CTERM sorting domain-containing protein [Verrucomicrobiae bacterium]
MKLIQTFILAATPCVLLPAIASATTVNVTGMDNIFAAGLSSAANVDPGNGGGGVLPLQIAVTGGSYQFQYLSGTVSANTGDSSLSGLDANGANGGPANITSYGGISGFMADRDFALVGVFLGTGAPTAPAPATINFTTATGMGANFLTLAPQIGQIFLIGDGTTSSAQSRTYYVPTGGTELYLGFADAAGFLGAPGQYGDNAGSVNINVTAAPEPAPLALMFAGSGLMAAFYFRNKRQQGKLAG